jgi:hypothetical protein
LDALRKVVKNIAVEPGFIAVGPGFIAVEPGFITEEFGVVQEGFLATPGTHHHHHSYGQTIF